jgi:hypothetical protein
MAVTLVVGTSISPTLIRPDSQRAKFISFGQYQGIRRGERRRSLA